MEGPTPVSALIHAATMVTAGVYLIVRTHPLFELAPHVQDLAAGLGALTLVMAGLIALVQTDIKRVIAVLDDVADRLHVPRGRARRLRERDVPPDDARVLQGAALPRRRHRHPRARRGAGHPQDGRPPAADAVDVGGDADRRARARPGSRRSPGFFSKDSILAAALDRGWYGDLLFAAGLFGRVPDRALHVPDAVHRLRRRALRRTSRSTRRTRTATGSRAGRCT